MVSISNLLILVDEGHEDFMIMRSSGFDAQTVGKFRDTACTVSLDAGIQTAAQVWDMDRLNDMPGLEETCMLASRIRSMPHLRRAYFRAEFDKLPLSEKIKRRILEKIPGVEPNTGMPPFDRVKRTKRLGWLRIQIMQENDENILTIKSRIYGFEAEPCKHLKNSILFADIKRIVQKWPWNAKKTIFE